MQHRDLEDYLPQLGGAFVVAVLLFALDGLPLFRPVKALSESFSSYLGNIRTPIVSVVMSPISISQALTQSSQKIAQLESQVRGAVVDQARLLELEEENKAMRDLLEVPLPPDWDYYMARVVAKRPHQIHIALGEVDGVKHGDPVLYEDVLLGIVSKTSARVSQVSTMTSESTNVTASVIGKNADGILRGKDGQLWLTEILQTADITEGDIVITNGSGRVLPGIVLGKVAEIITDSNGIHLQARLDSPVDISQIQTVFIPRQE